MKPIFYTNLFFATLLFCNLFFACKKDDFTSTELTEVGDVITANGIAADLKNLEEQAKTLNNTNVGNNCNITLDTSHTISTHDRLTIDFGSSASSCHDNRFRSGKIIVDYSPNFKAANADVQFSFSNYTVGFTATTMYAIENSSSTTVTHQTFNSKGFLSWTSSCNLIIDKTNSGGTITFNENSTRTQTAGNALQMDFSNKFSIAGSSSGICSDGNTFAASILSSNLLVKDLSCAKYFTKGELDITPKNVSTIGADFGDGSCSNNTVTLSRNYTSKIVDLQ